MRLFACVVLLWASTLSAAPTTQSTTQPTVARSLLADGAITAEVASGNTITLLGVSDNRDTDKRWWGVDGSALKSPPYASLPNRLGNNSFELPFTVSGKDAAGKPWSALNMHWRSPQTSLGLVSRRENGKNIPGAFVLLGVRPVGVDTIDVTINLTTNNEKTLLSLNIAESHLAKKNDPMFGDLSLADPKDDGTGDQAHATITALVGHIPANWKVFASALKDGRQVVPPSNSPYVLASHATTVAFTSPLQSDQTPDGVDTFRLSASNEGTRVVFRNIAVSPEVKSKPEVVVGDEE